MCVSHRCWRCGSQDHNSYHCRTKTWECYSCRKIGHIAASCRRREKVVAVASGRQQHFGGRSEWRDCLREKRQKPRDGAAHCRCCMYNKRRTVRGGVERGMDHSEPARQYACSVYGQSARRDWRVQEQGRVPGNQQNQMSSYKNNKCFCRKNDSESSDSYIDVNVGVCNYAHQVGNTETSTCFVAEVLIGDRLIKMAIDTCSDYSLISFTDYMLYFSNAHELCKTKRKIQDYGGQSIDVLGKTVIDPCVEGVQYHNLTLYVVVVQEERVPILGLDWLSVVEIDFSKFSRKQEEESCNLSVPTVQGNQIELDKDIEVVDPCQWEDAVSDQGTASVPITLDSGTEKKQIDTVQNVIHRGYMYGTVQSVKWAWFFTIILVALSLGLLIIHFVPHSQSVYSKPENPNLSVTFSANVFPFVYTHENLFSALYCSLYHTDELIVYNVSRIIGTDTLSRGEVQLGAHTHACSTTVKPWITSEVVHVPEKAHSPQVATVPLLVLERGSALHHKKSNLHQKIQDPT